MSDDLTKRLRANEQRRRAEEGRALRPNFVSRFERATGWRLSEDDFLSVQESDALVERAVDRMRGAVKDAEWHNLTPLVYAGLDAFAQRLGDAQFYLHAAGSDLMGMSKIPLRLLLSHVEAFWMPVDEDLIVVSAEAEDGLLLEWNDHWIELRTWGWLHDQLHDLI